MKIKLIFTPKGIIKKFLEKRKPFCLSGKWGFIPMKSVVTGETGIVIEYNRKYSRWLDKTGKFLCGDLLVVNFWWLGEEYVACKSVNIRKA